MGSRLMELRGRGAAVAIAFRQTYFMQRGSRGTGNSRLLVGAMTAALSGRLLLWSGEDEALLLQVALLLGLVALEDGEGR